MRPMVLRKGLAATDAMVVISMDHQLIVRSRAVRLMAAVRQKGYKALPFCIAKAVPTINLNLQPS